MFPWKDSIHFCHTKSQVPSQLLSLIRIPSLLIPTYATGSSTHHGVPIQRQYVGVSGSRPIRAHDLLPLPEFLVPHPLLLEIHPSDRAHDLLLPIQTRSHTN